VIWDNGLFFRFTGSCRADVVQKIANIVDADAAACVLGAEALSMSCSRTFLPVRRNLWEGLSPIWDD
jgi:hypothetical protein